VRIITITTLFAEIY